MKKMKSKVAKMESKSDDEMPKTPKEAMAEVKHDKSEEDMCRDGEYDLDALLKAIEIKNDPKKMEYVNKAHDKKSTALRSIADLKMAGEALAMAKTKKKGLAI